MSSLRWFRLALVLLTAGVLAAASRAAESSALEPLPAGKKAGRPTDPSLIDVPDVPGLPRVLLIGDSISMGYTRLVRERLQGRANVHRPSENCGDTARGLKNLDAWLGSGHWDVIHFNFGLHDLKYLDAHGKYVPPEQGRQVASPEQYAANLRELVHRLHKTGAKLVFATTTPVPAGSLGRVEGDEVRYNAAAATVMQEEGVAIDDLDALVKPRQATLQRPHNVHFTDEGYGRMADQVVATIRPLLPAAANRAESSARSQPASKLVHLGADGRLVYAAYDAQGDTILDFSNCGYGGGGVAIPLVTTRATLTPAPGGDDTARIQQAIDALAAQPVGADGFRGALLLRRGVYRIAGSLHVGASGIVLRGEGNGADGTVLVATGKDRRPLIQIKGAARPVAVAGTAQKIKQSYVPVGARTFTVADASGFTVGETVFVVRHGNAAWIHTIGMDRITPRASNPGSTKQWSPFDLHFDRVVTAVNGNAVTVDAPLACAIDERWGGGEIVACRATGRIEQVGLENLRGDSEFDAKVRQTEKTAGGEATPYLADENHALRLVAFDNVQNGWVRNVVALHFYHGVSDLEEGAKWITVQDSASVDPVSIITGGRRYPFAIEGQLNLVQRCYSRDDRHAFVFGARVPGPNAFVLCTSEHNHATSEPHHRWSCGGLYDEVRAEIAFQDRQWMGSGHGWAGANYVAWNTEGSLVCQQPPTAQNFAIGFVGRREPGAFKRPQGYWESEGHHVAPKSLYLQQLEDRLGVDAVHRVGYADATGARG